MASLKIRIEIHSNSNFIQISSSNSFMVRIYRKMLKNPNYVYGSRDITVPLHLNFGQFILDRMWMHKDRIAQVKKTRIRNS